MPSLPKLRFEPIESLHFDLKNPRLPQEVRSNTEIINWMLRDASILELMGSIGQQGFFPGEPLLVINGEVEGQYIVVEGNRRLTATKLLDDPNLASVRAQSVKDAAGDAKNKPKELPVIIYKTRDEILDYLGYRHITGVKEWDPLAKARYLKQLYDLSTEATEPEKLRALAKTIGSRADYVGRLLTGLAIVKEIEDENYFDLRGVDQAAIKFSILTTAINYTNVAHFIGLDNPTDLQVSGLKKEHLKELVSWISQPTPQNSTRLGESRNLKKLSEVLDSPKALQAFRDGAALDDAHRLTANSSEQYRQNVAEVQAILDRALTILPSVDDLSKQDEEGILSIIRTCRSIRAVIANALIEQDDL